MERKLRIFDLTDVKPVDPSETAPNGSSPVAASTIPASAGFEIGPKVHTAPIKFIVWTRDPNILITASGNTLRWFDLPTRSVVKQEVLDGEIGSCEFCALAPEYAANTDIGGGLPVLAVAAGKCIYFWGGMRATDELKRTKLDYQVASVAVDPKGRKMVVGEDKPATWARVYRWDDGVEIGRFIKRY
jgi:serine-threonine kinase receptor-associated protein